MKIIALANQKGGVGKTTSTINIGAGLSKSGKNVLLVDLDPQAHLTYSLGISAHELDNTIYQLLKGESNLSDTLIERNGLYVLPSTLDLSGADVELSNIAGREYILREILSELTDLDYILLDCPPSLGLLTLNALTTALEIYIPLQTEYLALSGLSKLLQTIEIVQNRLNENLRVTGIIATRFDSRKRLNNEVVDKIKVHFGNSVFQTMIRDNISLAEAPSFGKTIFEYKPNSYGAADYLSLCNEILNREEYE